MSEADHTEQFAVSAEGETGTRTSVGVRDFEFVVDEPAAFGGTDEGPTPVEYLLGAWAGCLNVVAHEVSEEYGVKLDGIAFEVEGDLDLRKFLGRADDVRAGFQEIRVQIDVDSDADEETLESLFAEVEERCPVGDTIEQPTPTDVTVERA